MRLLFFKPALLLPCLLSGLLAIGQNTHPARVAVERFSVEQGLADRNINGFARDNQGFLWVGTYNGLSRFDGYSFLNFDSRPGNPYRIHSNIIYNMVADRMGNLVVCYGQPSFWQFEILNTVTGNRTQLEIGGATGAFLHCFNAADGTVYFFLPNVSKSTLYRFNEKSGKVEEQFSTSFANFTNNNHFNAVCTADNSFWLSQQHYLLHTDAKGNILHALTSRQITGGNTDKTIDAVVQTSDGNLWISIAEEGVFKFENGAFKRFADIPAGGYLMSADSVGNLMAYRYDQGLPVESCFLIEPDGNLIDYSVIFEHQSLIDQVYGVDFKAWFVAGSSMGFNKYQVRPDRFKTYLGKNLGNEPYGIRTRGICKLGPHTLYILTENEGLYEVDTRTGATTRTGDLAPQLNRLNNIVLGRNLLNQGDSVLWICERGGVLRYQPEKKRCNVYNIGIYETWGIAFGKKDQLWVVMSDKGLAAIDMHTGAVTPYRNRDGTNPLAGNMPNCIMTGRDGTLWIGSSFNGLVRIDPEKRESRSYSAQPTDPSGFLSNQVACIYESESGLLWVGTLDAGVHVFDPRTGKVQAVYSREQGLSHPSAVGILPNGQGNFWISTLNGLSFFNTRDETFLNYSTVDGLSHNEFNRHSYHYDTAEKRFYFGGMNGVIGFAESDMKQVKNHAPLLVSELSFQTRENPPVVRATGIGNGTTITLEPGNTFLQLRLALADYAFPSGNQFAYFMDGLDEQWHSLGTGHDLRINYLPAGNYTLRLRGADNRGNWSSQEVAINIIVQEFWYRQWWAWMMYAGFLAMGGFYFYRFQLKKRIAEKETHRLQELDTFKNKLFTNISHEFRTPLTVILGTVGRLQDTEVKEKGSSYSLIRRNGEGLLRLVNQILDLAKLENNTLQMHYQHGNVLPYLRYVSESMHSLANAQGLTLEVHMPPGELEMDYDPDRLLQIVYNLLSNAVKFTPEGGLVAMKVGVSEADSKLHIAVSDTGVGIPASDLSYIFDQYYQADNLTKARTGGTGIGLSLTKELVQIMGGAIAVVSEPGKGSTFSVQLPITHNAQAVKVEVRNHVVQPQRAKTRPLSDKQRNELPLLLVIEDNPDVVEYIVACLQDHYELEVAYNGDKGLEMALELVPDLIVSDVMLPGKDGFELCSILKKDTRTSHVPIVLLTARADQESRISGLRRGADVYLAKPFYQEELTLVLRNLMLMRKRMQDWFGGFPLDTPPGPVDYVKPHDFEIEHQFVQQVRAAVETNIDNPMFSVQKLCQLVAMSQPQLHRKLTALTGKNATQFIRLVRLARAKVLLETTELTVREVAFDVGFDDPKYFSRVFSETFGVAPSKV